MWAIGDSVAPPFIPVHIQSSHHGYRWTQIPCVKRVAVEAGKVIHEGYVGSGTLTCVEQLMIRVHTSDDRLIASSVCMALAAGDTDMEVLVTPEARDRLHPDDIWGQLGGFDDDGDLHETQSQRFAEELSVFWAHVTGPGEYLRQGIMEGLWRIEKGWTSVAITSDGVVSIRYSDGSESTLRPPEPHASSTNTRT